MHAVAEHTGTGRGWRLKLIVLLVVLCSAGLILLFPGFILDSVLPDQTVYADSFSESKFARIITGMTESDVLQILGPPLSISEHAGSRVYVSSWDRGPSAVANVEFRWWAYTKRGCLTDSYNVRAVKFSKDGNVVEVLQRYYAD